MDDSINEFAKNLLARAKAREEGILKRQDNYLGQEQSKCAATPVSNSKVESSSTSLSMSIEPGAKSGVSEKTQKDEPTPTYPGNKENLDSPGMDFDTAEMSPAHEESLEIGHSDDDEEMENLSEVMEDNEESCGENLEEEDRIVPLSKAVSMSLRSMPSSSCPPSASPVSRKSRLSALAKSINAWEDDLTHVNVTSCRNPELQSNPNTNGGVKSSRFSVSTPPPPTNRLINQHQQNQRNSCHQFVSARSPSSPNRRVLTPSTPAPPATSSFSAIGLSALRTPSSPKKNSPVTKPVRRSISPMKSPLKTVTFETDREREPNEDSAAFAVTVEADEEEIQVASPQKRDSRSRSTSPVKPILDTKEDPLAKSLELQGYVKLQAGQFEPTPKPKVVSSIIKQRFDKFEPTPTNQSQLTKPKPASSVGSVAPTWQQRHQQQLASASVASPATPTPKLGQFNSRKSLQPDPSELTVAQKARLFEKQQKEQAQLKMKDVAASKMMNNNKRFAANSPPKPKAEPAPLSPKKAQAPLAPTELLRSPKRPQSQYYFGDNEGAPIPPPPPMPTQAHKSPKRGQSPFKRSFCETEDHEEDHGQGETSPSHKKNLSPSALIAKSVKRIKVVQKEDKMYPSLTDVETETDVGETDVDNENNSNQSLNSSMSTSSLGSFIQNKAQLDTDLHSNNSVVMMQHSEINTTMACRQIDELIDEALEGQLDDTIDTIMMDAPVPISASSPIAKKPYQYQPLMHSISVYRKNQQQLKKSEEDSTFKIPQSLNAVEEDEEPNQEELNDKFQNLEQKVLIQQKAISQASKALNVCESSFEFNNSTENVEGERVLLIATQKRCQLLSYISKIRNSKNLSVGDGISPSKQKFQPSSTTRSTLKMNSMQLYPVKSARLHQDYVYHFILLLKHDDTVLATSTVKTSANNQLIEFPNEFEIKELDPSFKIQMEVYALRTFKQIDQIPHHMKYHIKTPTKSSAGSTPTSSSKTSTLSHFLTPTRSSKHQPKATDLKSTTGPTASSNSNSIRTSNFTLQSVLHLNLSNLNNKTEWEMSMVSNNLILPNISMQIKCTNRNELNYKGFLTVFSDVSGLGAWHRRWAMIDREYNLLFWTYPEDETQDKPPVLTVALKSCITPRTAPAPRDVCARPNTFLLVTTRAPLPTDKDSLVVSVHEKYTAVKHLFSADNKPERDEWIGVVNKALTNMRAWGINN